MGLTARVALAALHRPERHRYGTDRSQVADLHVPEGPGPFPVAVSLHGGSWQARYGRLINRPVCEDLARRGWAAWNVEYRRLGIGGGWPQTFADVGAAIDRLAELGDPRLDLARVAAVGHSAGGQLALWAAGRGRLPEGAPGAAPRVGITEVVALAAVTDLVRAGGPARELLGGGVDEVPERYAQADPVRGVPLPVPVLLVHPGDDRTVPARRSREYAEAARAAGADVTLVDPGPGGHRAPIDPGHPAWHAAAAWLGR